MCEGKMKYDSIFKFQDYNIFLVDLFLRSYKSVNPITMIKNRNFEFFVPEEKIKELSEEGFKFALEKGFFERFKGESMAIGKEVLEIKETKIEEMNDEEFLLFLDKLFDVAKRFMDKYKITEFIYFKKIEAEIMNYIKDKTSFQDVLSGDADLAAWPEDKRKLADYIINVQKLKFELRKFVNSVVMGTDALVPRVIGQLIIRTNREDAPFMTLEEIKSCMYRKEIKDVSERAVYSFVVWKKNKLNILSGGEAYKQIRGLEKDIPKNEVIGTIASKGIAKGKVKIILLSMNPEKYLSKMEKGDILVSDTTGPEMMVAIGKAGAIVTDEGGQMSHAAIVSREFGIPCVVGTSYATKIFKDGDIVEVNANNGVVRKV